MFAWLTFFLGIVVTALFLYIPGFLCLSGANLKPMDSFILAPLVSIPLASLLAILLAKVKVGLSASSFYLVLLLISFIVFFCARFLLRNHQVRSLFSFSRRDVFHALLYLIVAIIITSVYFIIPLDGPSSFAQDSDNTFHLSLIYSMMSSGNYSCLDATLYHDLPKSYMALVDTQGSFYPSFWHMTAALSAGLLGLDAFSGANIATCTFLIIVLPLSSFVFNRFFGKSDDTLVVCGAFTCLAFTAFPWALILGPSGPVFPNFYGLSLVPLVVVVVFQSSFRIWRERKLFLIDVLLSFLGLLSLAFCHPNSVFTLFLIMLPFGYSLCGEIARRSSHTKSIRKRAFILKLFYIITFSALWIGLYASPALHGVTHFTWKAYESTVQALLDAVSLSFLIPVPQFLLAFVVMLGAFVNLLGKRGHAWLTFCWIVSLGMFILAASSDGIAKQILTGFWYTDKYRLAANAALISNPLAALGLASVIRFLARATRLIACGSRRIEGAVRFIPAIIVPALFCYFVYTPSYQIGFVYYGQSAFGEYNRINSYINLKSRPNLYDEAEAAFCKKVNSIVDHKYVIYNNADDGSSFAYAQYGLNLAYRRSAAELLSGNELKQSKLLRNSINELSTDVAVQQTLDKSNIRYILILDYGGELTDERCFYGYYTFEKWMGYNRINDSTPGLRILLSEGDMRLYEIESF